MRFTGRAVFLAILILGVFAALLGAQYKADVPKYDLSRQQTFSGIVGEVKDYHCPVSGTVGTHIALKEITETLEVHMAPATFLKEYGIVINPGEKVQVTGVKVTFDSDLDPATVNDAVTVVDSKGKQLDATASYANRVVTLSGLSLKEGDQYTLVVKTSLRDVLGQNVGAEYDLTFVGPSQKKHPSKKDVQTPSASPSPSASPGS